MCYWLRHHKAKRMTNNEFNVVRFLPARLGMVALKYMVYIRRVAILLRQEQSGGPNHSGINKHLLFCSRGKAWPPERLRSIIRTAASRVLRQDMTLQLYRQVSIGITEKHVREICRPINLYDDRSAQSDPNVVFAWQSGHRPIQRGTV